MVTELIAVIGTLGPGIKRLIFAPDSNLSMHVAPSGAPALNIAVTNSGDVASSLLGAAWRLRCHGTRSTTRLTYETYRYKSPDTPRVDGPAAGTGIVTDRGTGLNIYRLGTDGV